MRLLLKGEINSSENEGVCYVFVLDGVWFLNTPGRIYFVVCATFATLESELGRNFDIFCLLVEAQIPFATLPFDDFTISSCPATEEEVETSAYDTFFFWNFCPSRFLKGFMII